MKIRSRQLRKKYGLTPAQVDNRIEAQGGKCACCREATTDWCVDHDHKTGVVRGIVCRRCNTGIGNLGDDVVGVANALVYLQCHYQLASECVDEHF